MSLSRGRLMPAAVLALVLLGAVLVAPPAWSETRGDPWLSSGSDPVGLHEAVAVNSSKLPAEFVSRLRHEKDGILRVMVSVTERTPAAETFVDDATTWVKWYFDNPRFYAGVTPDQLQSLLESPRVRFVEPDVPLTYFNAESTIDVGARSLGPDGPGVWSFDPNGGPFGSLTSNIPGLTADQATGKGITVAITDSGIDRTFRDFGGWDCEHGIYQPCDSRILRAVSTEHLTGGMDPGDFLPTTEAASGHGSHVAGTVAGNGYYARDGAADAETYGADGIPFGVAPQANLVMTKNGDTIWAGLSQFGLEWQLENAEEYNIRVSSNSWGCLGGCSFNGASATGQLFKNMYEAGIVVTFAAGNDGGNQSGTAFSGNAQSPYVLGVASYEDDTLRLASSSSRGSDNSLPDAATWTPESEPVNGERRPDLAAPGVGIWSARTLTGGAASGVPRQSTSDIVGGPACCIRNYALMGGTSMATPHISGAAAIAFSACPTAQPLDVMRAFKATASDKVLKSNGSGPAEPFEVGYGALQVRGAIDWLLARDCDSNNGGGGDPDPGPTESPTPDPTTTPDPDPTETPTGSTQRYYFHSASGINNWDQNVGEQPSFDADFPTFDGYSSAYDVPGLSNTGPAGAGDPIWHGEIDSAARRLDVDLHASIQPDNALGSAHFNVRVFSGGSFYDLYPLINRDDLSVLETGVVRIEHSFTKMRPSGSTVTDPALMPDLALPAGPLSIAVRGYYTVDDAYTEILFDSKTYPSGFAIGTGPAASPTPTPTPTATATPTPTPTSQPPTGGGRGTYPAVPNDAHYGGAEPSTFEPHQWGPRVIKAPEAWQETRATGAGIKVAVIDSGVDVDHEDLQCPGKIQVVAGSDLVAGDGNPDDENGHGTHVAGIVGACTNNNRGVAGVAPDTTIVPIRVLNASGSGTDAQLIAGIDKAREAGVHVINMSLGYPTGKHIINNVSAINQALERARNAGIVVVAAAGNATGPSSTLMCDYPALAEDLICVGATDPRDNKSWYGAFAFKSDQQDTFGPGVVAPGGTGQVFCDLFSEEILSTYPMEKDGCDEGAAGYRLLNGTSMASPHVAGVAALVYDRLGGDRTPETAAKVIDAITSTAKDLGAPGYDPVYGYGRVDAQAAVVKYAAADGGSDPIATSLSFTAISDESGQYTDEATLEARLTDAETGAPVADADIEFELTGAAGTRLFTTTSDADGIARHRFQIVEQPGQYMLTARYAGDEDPYSGSADTTMFVVDREDSSTTLELSGTPNNRTATATLLDADDESFGLGGRTIEFFAGTTSLGTATTDDDGVAVFPIHAKDAKGNRTFEAVFEGDGFFLGSSASAQP